MTSLSLQSAIAPGKDRQVDLLFEGPRRKLIQITLRDGAVLAKHTAAVPITIQGIAGTGTLLVGDEPIALEPGALFTLEPNEPHEIRANPAVSFLLTQFTGQ
jgi:quercetin dioxygenase-like cupin family protein